MIIDIKLSTTKPLAWVIILKRSQNSMTINKDSAQARFDEESRRLETEVYCLER